jgi:hypothetical protein
MEEIRKAYTILVGKADYMKVLGRPRRRWEDNIKVYTKETGCKNEELVKSVTGHKVTLSPCLSVMP